MGVLTGTSGGALSRLLGKRKGTKKERGPTLRGEGGGDFGNETSNNSGGGDFGGETASPDSFKRGGKVRKSGMAKVHKGEVVLTEKQAKRTKKRGGKHRSRGKSR